MQPLEFSNGTVFSEGRHIYTISAAPGHRVYGERTPVAGNKEKSARSRNRRKLAA